MSVIFNDMIKYNISKPNLNRNINFSALLKPCKRQQMQILQLKSHFSLLFYQQLTSQVMLILFCGHTIKSPAYSVYEYSILLLFYRKIKCFYSSSSHHYCYILHKLFLFVDFRENSLHLIALL